MYKNFKEGSAKTVQSKRIPWDWETDLLDTCLLPGLTYSSEHHYWPVMHISNTSVRAHKGISLFNRTAACKTKGN